MHGVRANLGALGCALATIVGVLYGTRVDVGHGTAACVAALAFAGIAAMSRSRRARALAAAVCCLALAIAVAARAHDGIASHTLVPLLHDPVPIVLSGTLVNDPDPGRFDTTVLLRADRFHLGDADRDGGPWQRLHRTVLLRATKYAGAELDALTAGDVIELSGRARALTGFDARAVWQHAVARVDVLHVVRAHATHSPYLALANVLRGVIERGLAPLPSAQHALLDGFLLGDTRALDAATVADFRAAGLSHLLAVSGANVAFVLTLVAPVQRRLPIAGRFVLGATVVTVFAAMTRFEPSVLRASAMALIVMTARASGRTVSALRSLCYAVIVLLLIDPFLIHSVGFQLSASACAGIALFGRPLERWMPGPGWMRTVLAVTIAAQIGVAPVLIAVFGTVAWIAPAANLLAVPAAEPITVLAIPIAVLSALSPALASVPFVPVRVLLWWTRAVAHEAAVSPFVVVAGALGLVLGGVLFVRWSRGGPAVASPG